jgi:Asp-tRNA(Asn)/Glu-tRNA(Gln) amidotransferase A subunit family amidase
LTELLPEALADAKARDEYLSKTGKTIGPLHGLPISVKEQLGLGGKYTNTGFVAWVDRITPEDAAFVKSLKDLGAVIFARTNQPQSLMAPECSNNIYGTTVHPMNRALTPGGSTGGEAALMGMKASPMGMGGDIGGSIRIPAGLTGVRIP